MTLPVQETESKVAFTPGPWPISETGDGKRIIIGDGLVEGPSGYEVAEVYSDDCPREVAQANALLISAAPELLDFATWVADRGGDNNPMEIFKRARTVVSKATGASS